MLGDSALASSSGDAPAAAPASCSEDDRLKLLSGGGGGDEFGDRSFGGNRWPRQETIALLKIRSDMDNTFRDASVKGPLWDEVSRKLAELGYQRSSKKCKEKFENVYKYHKRTKEGRTGKPDGKTYRFFDQLTALENIPSAAFASPQPPPPLMSSPQPQPQPQIHTASTNKNMNTTATPTAAATTVPSIPNATATSTAALFQSSSFPPPVVQHHTIAAPAATNTAAVLRGISGELLSNSTSSSSSTDVDEEMETEAEGEGGMARRNKRKRKWKDFFERLMRDVIQRQEELQKRFLEAIERREQERMAREESWRVQEMSRINREREILAQERSVAAAKDSAVMAFLQKVSDQQQHSSPTTIPSNIVSPLAPTPRPPPPPPSPPVPAPPVTTTKPLAQPVPQPQPGMEIVAKVDHGSNIPEDDDGSNTNSAMGAGTSGLGSSRWPKTEVHDLIKLRTSLETKYQENGPKGPLWEEISAGMRRMGYNRSSKRCKEKWENINKYYKKVKESNKRRPEDSKTCPYFNLLDAIYREKMIKSAGDINAVPLMVQPEQQWPPPPLSAAPPPPPPLLPRNENVGSEEEDDDEELEDVDDDDDEAEEGGNNYELVASKPNSAVSTK